MTQKSKVVRLEDKVLEFEFEILQAQFNKNGNYFLKIFIQNLHRQDLLPQVILNEGVTKNLSNFQFSGSSKLIRLFHIIDCNLI